jgi:hypothetical protein
MALKSLAEHVDTFEYAGPERILLVHGHHIGKLWPTTELSLGNRWASSDRRRITSPTSTKLSAILENGLASADSNPRNPTSKTLGQTQYRCQMTIIATSIILMRYARPFSYTAKVRSFPAPAELHVKKVSCSSVAPASPDVTASGNVPSTLV